MTREEALHRVESYLHADGYSDTKEIIKALEQESCDDIVNRKLEELFERVENIEKQIKEDKEEQLKKLKAEVRSRLCKISLHFIAGKK